MASCQLTDLQSSIEVVVFSRSYERAQAKLVEHGVVVVDGKVDATDGRLRLLADGVYSLEEAPDRPKPGNGNGSLNGKNGSGSHKGNGAQAGTGAGSSGEVGPPRRLTVEFSRGSDREEDAALMERLYSALQR